MSKKKKYEKELVKLQIELLKLQRYVKERGLRVVILIEGRDTAGKGGTILRLTQHLNPRLARTVALGIPTEREKGEWYFQRYVNHFPTRGEMVIFDRSWYNRGGVEPVMGYCTKKEHQKFLQEVSKFEDIIIDDGIILLKFYLSIDKDEQAKRFEARKNDPLKQYKLSANDKKAQGLWDEYTIAKYTMLVASNTKTSPWTIVYTNDKKTARLSVIKHILSQFDYPEKISKKALHTDSEIVINGTDEIATMENKLEKGLLSKMHG